MSKRNGTPSRLPSKKDKTDKKKKRHKVGIFVDFDRGEVLVKAENPDRLFEFIKVEDIIVHMKKGQAFVAKEFVLDE